MGHPAIKALGNTKSTGKKNSVHGFLLLRLSRRFADVPFTFRILLFRSTPLLRNCTLQYLIVSTKLKQN